MGNCCTWEDDGDSSTGQSTQWADEAFPDFEDSYDGAEYEPVLESAESYDGTAYETSWELDSESELSYAGEARSPRPYPLAEAGLSWSDRRLHAIHFPVSHGITIGEPPWYELPLPPTWPPCTAGCLRKYWLKALPVTI